MALTIEVSSTLNPKIWKNNKLKPEIREKILEIVDLFKKDLEVPIEIVDIQLVGSNASYNYTLYSDLDVHILANYNIVAVDPSILDIIYNLSKTNFNKAHDISFYGVNFELYVLSIESATISNGIYSVIDDEWIKFPAKILPIKLDIDKLISEWEAYIMQVIDSGDLDKITKAINTLYLIRHNSLETDGEFGAGNQLFKALRNSGALDKLKLATLQVLDSLLTLESLGLGKFLTKDW